MPNWFKLATGWLLTVLVALAFSWGAIAQVRNRVDMPGTVIPTQVVVNGLEISQETPAPATTTATVQAIGVEPELETFSDTTTTGDVVADEPDDGATTQTTGAESSGTTSASTSDTSGTTTTTRSEPSGSAASAVPESSGTTSTTSADGNSAPTTTETSVTTTTQATTTTETPVTTTTEATTTTETPPPADPPPDDEDPPPADEPETQTATYNLTLGVVTISYSSDVVNLVGAAPKKIGYSAEIEKSGPTEVKVKFESDDHVSEFTAKLEDGKLDIEIDESPKDDDGDGDGDSGD